MENLTQEETLRAVRLGLAMSTNDELLSEVLARNLLAPCTGSMIIDGRAVRKGTQLEFDKVSTVAGDMPPDEQQAHAERRFWNFIELRLLEIMSRGLATAEQGDRVHVFTTEPAQGDLPPGSIYAKVEMMALRADPEVPDAASDN